MLILSYLNKNNNRGNLSLEYFNLDIKKEVISWRQTSFLIQYLK